jgi:hypothetical protein
VLGYTEDKVVATDFRGETCTSVFDADAGIALDGTFVKVVAWYDNEWGYSNKCLEMVRVVGHHRHSLNGYRSPMTVILSPIECARRQGPWQARFHPRRPQRPARRQLAPSPKTPASAPACPASRWRWTPAPPSWSPATWAVPPKASSSPKTPWPPWPNAWANCWAVKFPWSPTGSTASTVAPGQLVLLENCRVNKGEKKNNEELAKKMAALCDIFVNDAFGTAHRAEGTTYGIAQFAPIACAGPLLAAEIDAITKALAHPKRPLVAIVAGSKVSTKLTILKSLSAKVDG